MDTGPSNQLELISKLIDSLQTVADRLDALDARLKIVERPFCQHDWTPLHFDESACWCRVCYRCGLKEYVNS